MAIQATSAFPTSYPWSGNWWPQAPAQKNLYDNGGPLHYYDYYVWKTRGYNPGTQAWEAAHKADTDSWAGHCQAWAAASILTKEPPAAGVNRSGINFSHDTLEGLITSVYEVPTVERFWGTRYDGPEDGQAALDDLNPAWMDYLLRTLVKDQGRSFVMDIEKDAPVWNYPVAGYSRTSELTGDRSWRVSTDVWFRTPKNGVTGYDANSFFKKTYTYDLWSTPNGLNGRWVSQDHPDFAWTPGAPLAVSPNGTLRNPELDPKIVEEILGYKIT